MTGSNAGVKRNRLPSGTKATLIRDTKLHPDTGRDFQAAARASGNLSFSLYLERLHAQLVAENGALPILDGTQEAAHRAA